MLKYCRALKLILTFLNCLSTLEVSILNGWLKNIQYRPFKRRCVLCSGSHNAKVDLCPACLAGLTWLNGAQCKGCALPVPGNIELCGRCLNKTPFYDKTQAVFEYKNEVEWLIQQLKFKGKLIPGHILSQLIADRLAEQLKSSCIELMIPVPLHVKRIRARGFNQSVELFAHLAQRLALPMDVRSCQRKTFTEQQSGLNRQQRDKNIKNAFYFQRRIDAKNIAIVDDVMTTGSTVNELARVLKAQGADHVEVWVCARTPR